LPGVRDGVVGRAAGCLGAEDVEAGVVASLFLLLVRAATGFSSSSRLRKVLAEYFFILFLRLV
jgi:hypothetical protein